VRPAPEWRGAGAALTCAAMTPRDTATFAAPSETPHGMTPAELRAAFFRTFPAVAPSIVIGAVDQTVTATALPAIAGSLGAVESISWVVVAYLIAATVSAPVCGQLGDALGRRRLLLVSLALHAVGSAVAATSGSFGWLIVGRLLQGAGGGGLNTLTMAIIGEAVPPRERGRFQAWIAACFTLASALGPVMGGWLTGSFGWRAVFLAQLPLAALAFGMALRAPARPGTRGRGGVLRFDAPGVFLFAAFVAPALLALSFAQRLSFAALPGAALLAAVAALALVLLVWREKRVRDPLLPLGLLAEPTILRSNLFTACGHGALVALLTFLPIYLQSARGLAPGAVGLLLLPLAIGGGLGGLSAGRLMTATGLSSPIAAAGLSLATVGLVAGALLAAALPVSALAFLFGVVALGIGLSYPVSQINAQVAAGPARLGAAAASVQFARTFGAALATALLGALLFGSLAAGDARVAALFAEAVREGAAALLPRLPGAEQTALREGLAAAFRAAFLGAAAVTAIGAFMAWRVPLRRL
jgi:MFS family permease